MDEKLKLEWNNRAQREGLYAVMSLRWTLEQCRTVHEQHLQLLLNWFSPLGGKWVLDLGCGIGRLSAELSSYGAHVVGIDSNELMLEKFKKNLSSPYAECMLASADHLPVGTASFDAAFAVMLLQHILDDDLFMSALKELSRVVKVGGRILIIDCTDKAKYQPINSPITIVRTPEEYDVLKSTCLLLSFTATHFADDKYSIMVWERRSP